MPRLASVLGVIVAGSGILSPTLVGSAADPVSALSGGSPAIERLGDPPIGAGFVLPIAAPAVILMPFRPPAERWGAGHRGVDLNAPVGALIRSAGPGRVVFAGQLAGRGVVSVEHDGGLRTTYEPVTAMVSAGESVGGGTALGTLEPGHAACAPASCLHWGARSGDTYLDPMALITSWRVRLLPWEGRP